MKAVLYYRGALTSCNYDCPYCPFGKRKDSRETLARDKRLLSQFVEWVEEQAALGHELSIFFNPYGEALIHRWYKEAMIKLSQMRHVNKVAIQTNLSTRLDWVQDLNREKIAFWATYHPGQVKADTFLQQCLTLHRQQISLSVGSVGMKSAFDAIEQMRNQLPKDIYLWVNAFKDQPDYYEAADLAFLKRIDPLFGYNLNDYESAGKSCRSGASVFYVQADGRVKRCYKDRQVIGHLYRDGLAAIAADRPCRMQVCDCYIGYIHMTPSPVAGIYGEGLLERVPVQRSAVIAGVE